MNDIDKELAQRFRDAAPPSPDVTGWGSAARGRAGRTSRTKMAGAAVAVCLAVAGIAIVTSLIGPADNARPAGTPTAPPTEPSATPTTEQSEPASPVILGPSKRGEIRVPGGDTIPGYWENGEVLGEPLVMGDVGGHEQILYAARHTGSAASGEEPPTSTYIAVGFRQGKRILMWQSVLSPTSVSVPDGVALYGGARTEWPFATPSYRLLGSVKGDAEVRIADDRGEHPPTKSSTTLLPGYTVFYDQAEWNPDWDVLRIAPLTVLVGNDRIEARKRSSES